MGDTARGSSLDKVSLVFSVLLAALFPKERLTWQIAAGGCFNRDRRDNYCYVQSCKRIKVSTKLWKAE